jgi:hypothetical protein
LDICLKITKSINLKYEPIINFAYTFLLSNIDSNENLFSFLDYVNLIVFLLPYSLYLLDFHFHSTAPGFFLQNILPINLIGVYYNGNLDLTIFGIFNIFISLSLLAADEETYYNFSIYFDLLGISPYLRI